MTTDESTSKMNEIVLKNASHAFVLADAEKFNRDSFIRYAALSEVEMIFTDPGVDPGILASFRDAGARIQVVPQLARHPSRATD
jgi:DeoR family fructose operon transcriptional repressor